MKILVSEDFYRRPAGRYRDRGTYTGEAFREDILIRTYAVLFIDSLW